MPNPPIRSEYSNRPLTNAELWTYDSDDVWTLPLVGAKTPYGVVIISFVHCVDNSVRYLVFDQDIERWVMVKERSMFDLSRSGSGEVIDIVQQEYADDASITMDDESTPSGTDDFAEEYDSSDVLEENEDTNLIVFTETIEGIVESLPQSPLSIVDIGRLSDMPGVSVIPHVGNADPSFDSSGGVDMGTINDVSQLPRPVKEVISIILIVDNGVEESDRSLIAPIIYTDKNWEPIDLLAFDSETESPLDSFAEANTSETDTVSKLEKEHGNIVRLFNA